MTSTMTAKRVYVWTWLPGEHEPVVAGVIEPRYGLIIFAYGR